MKLFLTILILLLAVILQTTLVPFLAFVGVSPNLVLVLLLFWVILRSFKKVWIGVLLTGLFLDFFSGLPFGLISLSLVGTAFLIDWFNRNIFSMVKFWVVAVLIILGTLIYNLLFIGLAKMFILAGASQVIPWYSIESFVTWLFRMTIEILYNLLIAVIFFYGAKKIFHQE